MTELAVLQAVRLKGRVSRDDLAATLGGDFVDVVDRLVGSGLLLDGPTLRLSPEGRGRLEDCSPTNGRMSTRRWSWRLTTNFVPSTPNSRRWSPIGSSRTASPTRTRTSATTRRCWPVSTMCIGG